MGVQKFNRPVSTPGLSEAATSSNPLGGIQASELAQHVIRTAVVALSAAQLMAMFAAPVSVLPAPGSGYAIVDISADLEMLASATAFTSGGAVSLVYHGGAVSPVAGTVPAAVVTAGAGTTLTQLGPAVGSNGITVPANTGIDITNATGAFATGTGTAKLFLKYRIIQL